MKKVNALVIGIVFLFVSMIPFTSAFADSDPGISTAAFNASFGWYTGFPMVDSYGYLDINDWTITYQSNGTPSSNPSSGDVVYLYQPGDFVEISFSNWDLLSSYTTPVWCVQFGQNPSYSGNLQDAKYTLYQSYNTSECFYKYNRSFSYDNREIKWAHCFFTYPGGGVTKIRVEYDGTPVIWNAIYIKFLGYRNEPNGSTYTQADLLQLQASISSTLSLARLADLVELDLSDVDLSTLEATTASILQKLANVPDIIQYIDQIETLDSSILSGITSFLNYYTNQTTLTYSTLNSSLISCYVVRNNETIYNGDTSDLTSVINLTYGDIVTFCCSIPSSNIGNFYTIRLPVGCDRAVVDLKCTAKYYLNNSNLYRPALIDRDCLLEYYNNSTLVYIPYCFASSYTRLWISLYIDYNTYTSPTTFAPSVRIASSSNYFVRLYNSNQVSYLERILLYLEQMFFSNVQVPSGIQQTTDTVTEQVTDIVEFEDNYNTSLENSASQIDVSSYEIQQTQGMSFMRTYTELNFDRMQNFRILFLTPLILALAAFFLRRKT